MVSTKANFLPFGQPVQPSGSLLADSLIGQTFSHDFRFPRANSLRKATRKRQGMNGLI
jgi:hypothetical protein